MRRIFVPVLDAVVVNPILKKHGYKMPDNVEKRSVNRWYKGKYYGYGHKDSWIPLNSMGGIATKAFHDHKVKFPQQIEAELQELLGKMKRG